MSSQPPSDLNLLPTTVDQVSLKRTREVLADPVGVPVRPTTIDAERRPEHFEPAIGLDPDFHWFYPGFAYVFVGIELSLFELYQAAGNKTIPVKSHKTDRIAVDFSAQQYLTTRWAPVFQGIPISEAVEFTAYIASYVFRRKFPEPKEYQLDFVPVRMADPFQSERRGVTIDFLLPRNLQSGRRVAMIREPGLLLNTPLFSMVQDA